MTSSVPSPTRRGADTEGTGAPPVGDDTGAAAPCRIHAKSWETVALWSWNASAESCAICKCALSDACIECQTRVPPPRPATHHDKDTAAAPSATLSSSGLSTSTGGDALAPMPGCQVSWGACGHVFHSHCLARWLPQRPSCPLCNRTWELRQVTSND